MWRKAMVALGLQDDEDDAEFLGYDLGQEQDYPTNQRARQAAAEPRITRPSAMPTPSSRAAREAAPTVRTIANESPVRPQSIRTMPMTAPASPSVHVCEPKSF